MKELNQVRVDLEEMDERIADAKKDMYDFRRDIIEEGQDPRTGKTIAEKMVKYLEDRIRSKDTMIEKLRLKNANLKVGARPCLRAPRACRLAAAVATGTSSQINDCILNRLWWNA